jgi:hypothetical protein
LIVFKIAISSAFSLRLVCSQLNDEFLFFILLLAIGSKSWLISFALAPSMFQLAKF